MNRNFHHGLISFILFFIIICLALPACKNKKQPATTDIAATPEELDKKLTDNIRELLAYASASNGDIGDSVFLYKNDLAKIIYDGKGNTALWSKTERWTPAADSLIWFIAQSRLYGLFPEDYHFPHIDSIQQLFTRDSLAKAERRDAALWSKADVMLTDAFIHIVKDIKLGRLPNDSISMRKDSVLTDEFYQQQLTAFLGGQSISGIMQSIEPKHEDYLSLKAGIRQFLDSADYRTFTIVPSPKDSIHFRPALKKRLFEGGYLANDSVVIDSAQLADAVRKFQKQKNITVDGKAGEGTVRLLNMSDRDRFVRIAISMDRYKLLPEQMPPRYIWVNLPSFSMKLQDGDSVKLISRIICGRPLTRTPLLTSSVSEIITYPQWTVPTSIIVKEILPAIKRNPDYLAKKGFSLVDKNGDEVDPYTVDWSKYSKGIPYKVVQGSGDANALGVLKFNFPNKYAVYLHDTNQRYLFSQAVRSMSHGCVRVQEWQKLADYLIRKDDDTEEMDDDNPRIDSMNVWLERKEKHSIAIRNKMPVYIRYFTCEGKNGGIVFYDDIYNEDKKLRERHFAGK